MRTKVTLTVEVELDPIPGAFSTPESAKEHIQYFLNDAISHYNPIVQIKKD